MGSCIPFLLRPISYTLVLTTPINPFCQNWKSQICKTGERGEILKALSIRICIVQKKTRLPIIQPVGTHKNKNKININGVPRGWLITEFILSRIFWRIRMLHAKWKNPVIWLDLALMYYMLVAWGFLTNLIFGVEYSCFFWYGAYFLSWLWNFVICLYSHLVR